MEFTEEVIIICRITFVRELKSKISLMEIALIEQDADDFDLWVWV